MAHWVYAGSSPSHSSPKIDRPDTPPDAIWFGNKNKLNATAIRNEPKIIDAVSTTFRHGPFRGIKVVSLFLRLGC
ncbi:hypothetical protein D3C73_1299990 [compost metagenome]